MAADQKVLQIIITAKNQASKALQGTAQDIGGISAAAKAGTAITGFGTASALALNKAGDEAAAYASQVTGIQRATGETAAESSKWAAILGRSGVTGAKATMVMKSLATNINGSSKALQEMGIATKDANGANRSSTDVLADVAEYYSKAEDKTKAAALASKVLGRGYASLLPVLAGGAEGIDKLTAKAQEYGLILTQDNLDAVKKYAGLQKDNDMATQGLTVSLGLLVLPMKTLVTEYLNKFITFFTGLPGPVKNLAGGVAIFVTGLALVAGPILMLIGFLPQIAAGIGMVSSGFIAQGIAAAAAWLATLGPVALVIAAIALVAGGVYLVVKNWDRIGPFFQGLWDRVIGFFKGFWTRAKAFVSKWGVEILAVLVPFIGVPLLLRKHWDKIGPFLKSAWDKAKAFVRKWGPEILAVLVPVIGIPLLLKKHWGKISAFFGEALAKAKTVVQNRIASIVGVIRKLPQLAANALKSLGSKIAEQVKKALVWLNKLNPFHRNSPSLVDHVLAGTAVIAAAYGGLSGLSVPVPAIATGSYVAPQTMSSMAGRSSAAAGNQVIEIPVVLDGREVTRVVANTSSGSRRTGVR